MNVFKKSFPSLKKKEQKVIEDMHGNRYPVGELCEVDFTIKYV